MRAKNASCVHSSPILSAPGEDQESCHKQQISTTSPRNSRFRHLITFALVALMSGGLIACADDDKTPAEECEGDECEDNGDGNGDGNGDQELKECLAIVSTQWGAEGSLSILDVESFTIETNITTLHDDVGLALNGNLLYAINRMGEDNIQAISIDDEYAVLWQYSVGNGANPQKLVVSENYGFIPALSEEGGVLIVDLDAENEADFLLDQKIEIDPIDTWDGEVAEIGNVLVHDGVLYVVSQGLGEDWACADDAHSQLLAFDAKTFEPALVFDGKATLDLETCNASDLYVIDDTLYVTSLGTYRTLTEGSEYPDDGGIEAIALDTGISLGLILTETQAGEKDILQSYAAKDGKGLWVVVGGADFFVQTLHYLDVSDDDAELSEARHEGYIGSLTESDDYLFITDRTTGLEGLAILDASTFEPVTEELIDTGLPPDASLLFERMGSCF